MNFFTLGEHRESIALLLLALPFLVAPLAPLLTKLTSRSGYLLATVPALMGFGLLQLWVSTPEGAVHGTQTGHSDALRAKLEWVPSYHLSFDFLFDGLALSMAILVCGVATLIFVYAAAYFKGQPRLGWFWSTMLVFLGAMVATVSSDSFMSFFIFWELTSVCSFLLIGYNHESSKARGAAIQALLVTGLGGVALLIGFLLLGNHFSTWSFSALLNLNPSLDRLSTSTSTIALVLVLLAAITKSAQFPFHFWLPGAMAAPTPISAFLHSATMVKLGVFLLARISPLTVDVQWWNVTLVCLGACTFLVGMWNACLRSDLKQVLAHTTVATLGTLTMILGVPSSYAPTAALLLLLAHALYKAALFMVCGSIDHAVHSRELPRLYGLGRHLPLTALAAGVAALSMAGVPPAIGFLAKEYLYKALAAAVTTGDFIVMIVLFIAFLGNVLGVVVAISVGFTPFWRKAPLHHETSASGIALQDAHEGPAGLWIPPLILATLTLLVGCMPESLTQRLVPAVSAVGSGATVSIKLWSGVNAALLLSIATLSLGGLLWWLVARTKFFAIAQRDMGSEIAYRRVLDVLITTAQTITDRLQHGSTTGYMRVILTGAVAAILVSLISSGSAAALLSQLMSHTWFGASSQDLAHFFPDLVVGSFMILAAVAALFTDSRIAALAELGIVGLGMSLLFVLYGAPDLALTTLLVETLSLIVFVVVLLSLPSHLQTAKEKTHKRTRLFDSVLACGAACAFTMLVVNAQLGSPGTLLRDFFGAHSYLQANGKNVVNVILVDFRAFDTMGEITVLCLAAIGVVALICGARQGRSGKER